MGYLSICSIFLLSMADGIIFICLLISSEYIGEAFAVHCTVSLIICLMAGKVPDEYKGVPSYLAFFMPGLGGIITSVLYFAIRYFVRDSMVLEEYENYISYKSSFEFKGEIDYIKEMRTLSFIDQMNLLEAQTKKQLIIDASISYYTSKIKILQKGLADNDREVQHYSAVSINMIENEYSLRINHLREEYSLYKNLDTLEELSKVYKDYIDSGLLTGEILSSFNDEYIDILNTLIKGKRINREVLNQLIKAYLRGKNLERAEQFTYLLLDLYSDWIETLHFLIYIYHEKKDYATLGKLTQSLEDDMSDVKNEYKDMIDFWKNKGAAI